ncbi:hypothetical protein [Phytoactinopolyspora mesophila]|uniref:YozE SAM-like domain-containing protein n=1 Tax=Phytoactinopolyspora mesophila TaxID=2650750 RepID=A0A7K3M5U1_9ACTN|nr:hypothetical protein [Phytoactinopolyspora mesophila]NDL58616.1 hypothetical protein [Phytoactinopolyspora mesophila]
MTAQIETFGHWLSRQTGRRWAVGDLARDFMTPNEWDVVDTDADKMKAGVRYVLRDLDCHPAIDEAYEAFDRAVIEWATNVSIGSE